MILDRVLRAVVGRHGIKRYALAPAANRGSDRHWSKRTGWSAAYKPRRWARYGNLIEQLNRVREITQEERVEILTANLAGALMDTIEDFALYVLIEIVPTEVLFDLLSEELERQEVTLDQLRDRMMRANVLMEAGSDGEIVVEGEAIALTRQFYRVLTKRRIDHPRVLIGENKTEVWREQEELTRKLAPARDSITRSLIDRVHLRYDQNSLVVVWTDRVQAMLAESGFHRVDTGLFRLDEEHLWIGLSVSPDGDGDSEDSAA